MDATEALDKLFYSLKFVILSETCRSQGETAT